MNIPSVSSIPNHQERLTGIAALLAALPEYIALVPDCTGVAAADEEAADEEVRLEDAAEAADDADDEEEAEAVMLNIPD